MKFRHLTNHSAEHWKIGGTYEANFDISNYWKQKQESEDGMKRETNDVLAQVSNLFSKVGMSIDTTFLSNELQKTKYYSELLKEYIFEDIRRKEFNEKPSRQNCMFLLPYEFDPSEYAKQLGFTMNERVILEIEASDDSRLHYADLNLLNCNTYAHNMKEDFARKYWQGTDTRNMFTEILFTGRFKILNIT